MPYTYVVLAGMFVYLVLMVASIARAVRKPSDGAAGPLGLRVDVVAGWYVAGALLLELLGPPVGVVNLDMLVGAFVYVVLTIDSMARVFRQSRTGGAGLLGLWVVVAGCYVVSALYFVPVIQLAHAGPVGDVPQPASVYFGWPFVLIGVWEATAALRLLRTGRPAAVLFAHAVGIAMCILLAIVFNAVGMTRLIIGGFAVVLVILAVLALTPLVRPPDQATPNLPAPAQPAGEVAAQPAEAIPGQPVTGVHYRYQPGLGKVFGIIAIWIVAGVCAISASGALFWYGLTQGFGDEYGAAQPPRDIMAVPGVGLCYTSSEESNVDRAYNTAADSDYIISCSKPHDLETVAAGTFPDNSGTQPANTAASVIGLYRQCSAAVDAFLGQPWAGTYAWAVLSVPSSYNWSKGAHWYRCDVMGASGIDNRVLQKTSGTMKGAPKPITTCLSWTMKPDGWPTNTQAAACNIPHSAEIIGTGQIPPGVDLTSMAVGPVAEDVCGAFITSYIGEANGELPSGLFLWYLRPHTTGRGTGSSAADPDPMLDLTVICTVGSQNGFRALNGSLKNLGNKPIPYAN